MRTEHGGPPVEYLDGQALDYVELPVKIQSGRDLVKQIFFLPPGEKADEDLFGEINRIITSESKITTLIGGLEFARKNDAVAVRTIKPMGNDVMIDSSYYLEDLFAELNISAHRTGRTEIEFIDGLDIFASFEYDEAGRLESVSTGRDRAHILDHPETHEKPEEEYVLLEAEDMLVAEVDIRRNKIRFYRNPYFAEGDIFRTKMEHASSFKFGQVVKYRGDEFTVYTEGVSLTVQAKRRSGEMKLITCPIFIGEEVNKQLRNIETHDWVDFDLARSFRIDFIPAEA